MKKRANFWFGLWGISLIILSIISAISEVSYTMKTGKPLITPPFTDLQLFLLILVPVYFLPTILIAHHYAVKEGAKKIKFAARFIIVHHVLLIFALLLYALGCF